MLSIATVDDFVDFMNHSVNLIRMVEEPGEREPTNEDDEDEGDAEDCQLIRELIITMCGKARGRDNPILPSEVIGARKLLTKFVNRVL